MFYPEESLLALYLGDWAPYYGPKVFIDFIVTSEAVNSVVLILLYYFLQNKMLFWLDHMQFDSESRSFYKLNLSVSDCKRFTKRFAMLLSIIQKANYFLVITTYIQILVSFMLFRHDYYIYFFISIT